MREVHVSMPHESKKTLGETDPADAIDWNRFRARIEHEDHLLNSRVNVFLITNGLGATAIGSANGVAARLAIAGVMLVVCLLLSLCTLQTAFAIRSLTLIYIRQAQDPIDQCVRRSLAWFPRRVASTPILGVWLPLVVSAAWLVGLVVLIALAL